MSGIQRQALEHCFCFCFW